MACKYGWNTVEMIDENKILKILNQRTEGLSGHSENIKDALKSLDQQIIDCTKDINDKIDETISLIEEKRKLLLDEMRKCFNEKKRELEKQLNEITFQNKKQNIIVNDCKHVLSNKLFPSSLKSIKMNAIIAKKKFYITNVKSFKVNKAYKQLLRTNGYRKPKISDIFGYYFYIKWSDKYSKNRFYDLSKTINIPLKYTFRQLVIEHWFRIFLHINSISDLYTIISEYFKLYDKWDPILTPLSLYDIRDNETTLYKGCYSGTSGFGSLIAKPGSIYHWKFKIIESNNYMMFGVIENNNVISKVQKWWREYYGYAYANNGQFYHQNESKRYGQSMKTNDIIDIWLDLKSSNISFGCNNQLFGVATKVKENTNYRLAVGTANATCIIQMID